MAHKKNLSKTDNMATSKLGDALTNVQNYLTCNVVSVYFFMLFTLIVV